MTSQTIISGWPATTVRTFSGSNALTAAAMRWRSTRRFTTTPASRRQGGDETNRRSGETNPDEAAITAARVAYDALTEAGRTYVTNLAKLEAAEPGIGQARFHLEL